MPPEKDVGFLVIALILVSAACGVAGAVLAVLAGQGVIIGILSYMAGGMIGTTGLVAFCMLRCALTRNKQHVPNAAQFSR